MGKTITYDGQLIYAAYHAISSGTTETGVPVWNVDYPYLQSVPSPATSCPPQYSSEASFTAEQFSAAVSGIADGLNLSGDPAGWITGEAERTAARDGDGADGGRGQPDRPAGAGGARAAFRLLYRRVAGKIPFCSPFRDTVMGWG